MTNARFIVGFIGAAGMAILAGLPADAQQVPELLYYKFNEASGNTTANLASPGVGSNPATIGGYTMGPGGQFAAGLLGAAGNSSTNYVDTGWVTALGTGSWTLSFWLDNRNTNPGGTLQYFCCDTTAGSLRIFSNGVAGAENLLLRQNQMTDVLITGGASYSAPTAVAWVYDATVPEIRAYLNGVLVNTVAQPALNITGTGTFRFAAYATNTGLMANGVLDEFRLYNRALGAAEIASTWNADLGVVPVTLSAFSVE